MSVKVEPDSYLDLNLDAVEDRPKHDTEKLELNLHSSPNRKKTDSNSESIVIKVEPLDLMENCDTVDYKLNLEKLEPDNVATFESLLHQCQRCQISFADIFQFTKHCQEIH